VSVRILQHGDFEILVGKGASENDELTFRIARPSDLWLHAAGYAGSHVVVRAADGPTENVPPDVVQRAAECAVWHSKARDAGGKVAVHLCRVGDVSKRKGSPPGQVMLRTYHTLRVYSRDPDATTDAP
jgi:predicted ribosome quality control (RQC) complex YloA/Tae2 family protein